MAKTGVERIDTKAFDEVLSKFKSTVNVFNTLIGNMDVKTTRLLNNWEGEGRKAFEKAYTKLKTAIKDETENLEAIRIDLQAIRDSYLDWDKEASKVLENPEKK